MKRIAGWMALAMLVGAVPAFAGGEKCTAADAQACLNHMSAMKDRGWVGLEFDKTDAAVVKVKAITPGSPAEKAGFAVGDVLVAINGANLADKEAMKKAKGEWKVGQVVAYTVKREGADKELKATLDPMPEAVFASMIGSHMLDAHLSVATAAETGHDAPSTQKAEAAKTEKTDKK